MRRLADEEKKLWARVVATVKPLRRSAMPLREEPPEKPRPIAAPSTKVLKKTENTTGLVRLPAHQGGLDAGWDRRLARGLVRPDVMIDLHGHSLATAHDVLDHRLAEAIMAGGRLVLLIIGKPPRVDRFPITRGGIRPRVNEWSRNCRNGAAAA